VELRLLAKIFEPQEAALAAEMRVEYEPAATIAARLGADSREAYRTLKSMGRKGQIRVRRGEGELLFALMPFVVGIYEEQLPRLDAELAALTEQYFEEIGGRTILDTSPPIHRVLPVDQAIPFDLEVFPYERAAELVNNARSWGVRDCICRVQQSLLDKGCDRPVEVCLTMAPIPDVFHEGGVSRPISREEALEILQQAADAGLVHTTGNFRDHIHYICNCCSCCCAVLRGVVEFHVPTAIARAGFRTVVESVDCLGCGVCEEACPFDALTVEEMCIVDTNRCLGCGQCIASCPTGALRLERLPDTARPAMPDDLRAWMNERAEARSIK
jgi:ferredoxin